MYMYINLHVFKAGMNVNLTLTTLSTLRHIWCHTRNVTHNGVDTGYYWRKQNLKKKQNLQTQVESLRCLWRPRLPFKVRMTKQCLMDVIDIVRADVMYKTKRSKTDVDCYKVLCSMVLSTSIWGHYGVQSAKCFKVRYKSVHCLVKHCWTNN